MQGAGSSDALGRMTDQHITSWPIDIALNGLCRFSYPFAPGSFGGAHDSLDDLRAQLYAPARLRERMFIFRHIFLPPLIAQTDPDFTVAVLVGAQLPAPFMEQMIALVQDIPAIRLIVEPEGQDPKTLCNRIFIDMRRKGCDLVGEFRLDDDDTVAVDFIAAARKAGQAFAKPILQDGMAGLDYASGAFVYFTPQQVDVHRVVLAHLSCGQVVFLDPASRKSAIRYHHYRMWRKNLYLSLPDQVMYLRSVHAFNASGIGPQPKSKDRIALTEARTETMMKARFDIDLHQLRLDWQAWQADA